MGYKRLSDKQKKAISKNANAYAKQNYKQISLKLSPDLADKLDSICRDKNISRPELIKLLIDKI